MIVGSFVLGEKMREKDEFSKSKDAWFSLNKPEMKESEVDAVVFGIPFDEGVSYRGGASEAPKMLRKNTLVATPTTESLCYFEEFTVFDSGDFISKNRDELFKEVEEYVEYLVKNNIKFTMVGGDHSVTIPVEKGINNALNEEFGIIHIDAHMDLCETLSGDRLSHGCVQKRALEMENIGSLENLFFIGIRSIEPDEFELYKKTDIKVKTAYDCYKEGIESIAKQCIEAMKPYKKVYLTFDIDALDPAYAGGTGTPQFGGLTSRMVLTLLEELFSNINIIGFDVVEISPPLDDSLNSMYAGRKIISEAWGYWAKEIGKLIEK